MSEDQDIRWKQRFDNFDKALQLLREPFALGRKLSDLEKQGVIQRFEFTLELAWKVLKDRMQFDGLILDSPISPKSVVRQAYQSTYLNEAEIWIRMINDRNLLSHTYEKTKFDEVVSVIESEYLSCLSSLHKKLRHDF